MENTGIPGANMLPEKRAMDDKERLHISTNYWVTIEMSSLRRVHDPQTGRNRTVISKICSVYIIAYLYALSKRYWIPPILIIFFSCVPVHTCRVGGGSMCMCGGNVCMCGEAWGQGQVASAPHLVLLRQSLSRELEFTDLNGQPESQGYYSLHPTPAPRTRGNRHTLLDLGFFFTWVLWDCTHVLHLHCKGSTGRAISPCPVDEFLWP